jgi:DNA mismatch endonuclease (patch repair protein)
VSRIRSGNTKPEMLVRKFLHAQGFRYKLHDKSLPDKPDLLQSENKHFDTLFSTSQPILFSE